MYGIKKRNGRREIPKRAISIFIACIFLFISTGVQFSFADEDFCYYDFFSTSGDVGQYSSIALDGSSPIACYYRSGGYGSGDLRFSGLSSAGSVTIDSGNVGQYCSLAKDGSTKHVSYYDAANTNLKYANSGSWNPVEIDTGGNVGQYTSIAIDSSHYPHISYYDATNGALKHAYKNSSGWHTETIDTSDNTGQYSSIAIDSSGNIHVSYYDATNKDLWYAYKNGSSWSKRAVDNEGDAGKYSSIAINSSNRPMISYYANGNLKYAKKTSSSNWQISTVDSAAGATSIACDSDNKPHIAYMGNSNKLKYAYFGEKWQTFSIDDMSSSTKSISIAVKDNNQPHISYYDSANDAAYVRVDAPLITDTDPEDSASGVSATKSAVITFSKNIQAGSNFDGISISGSIAITSSSISGNKLTIKHGDFSYGKTYTINIPSNAISNYPIAYTFSFKTKGDAGPAVSSTDPADGEKDVPIDDNITVKFNEDIKEINRSSNSIALKDNDGKSVGITISIEDNILTIKPNAQTTTNIFSFWNWGGNNLATGSYAYDKTYTVTIPKNSIYSLSGKGLTSDYKFSFETAPHGPTVSSADPKNNATEVPLNKIIKIRFNDIVYTGPSWSDIKLKDSDGYKISSTISLLDNDTASDSSMIKVVPSSNLEMNNVYKVTIPKDAVKDSDGRYMASDYTLNFSSIKSVIPSKPARLKVSKTTASTIQLTWKASKSALSYNIYRRSGKNAFTKIYNTKATSFADVSAQKKVTYVYAVSAIGTGGESAKSEVIAYIGMILPQFVDVSNGDWYKVYVDALCKREAITGYSDDLFHPERNITRAEFAKILCLGMGWPLRTPRHPTYSDVPKTHWAFAYIETASSNKAFQGYVDRSFRPEGKIYRADAAKIAATSLRLKKGSSKLKDINSSWARNYINMCATARVISGFPDGTFKPALMITRAEACRIICGMITYNTRGK